MAKAHSGMTLVQLKDYVKKHKLDKPQIKLSMGKADLIAGLKKHGHWDTTAKTAKPKAPSKPKAPKPQSVKEIKEAMKKIPSKSGHKDKPKKEVQKKPPTISGVTWKKNSGGWNTTVMINGKSEFFSFEEDGQILDDDFEEVSLEKFKKIVRASAPKEKPKAKPKAKPKMGKSITIKFDRHGGNWNTFPLEGVGHFKGKDIVYDHKGDEVKFRKYTYKMLHTITHSPTKWIVRDPDEPNQYYMTDGFGYKNSRSFILQGDVLREQDIDAPLSSMKVGHIDLEAYSNAMYDMGFNMNA
tara:strand:- start:1343 stop:2233 length:891 start_codon:yes stop_codon:yes gene_type:complete